MHITNNSKCVEYAQFNCFMLHFELFLNRIYYSLHNINFFISHYVFGKPIVALFAWPLYCIPFVKKHLEKKGLDFKSWMKISNDSADNMLGSFYTSRFMSFILMSPFLLLAEILIFLIGESFRVLLFDNLLLFFVVIGIATYLICDRFVWKDDRYQKYFLVFEKEEVKKKVVWGLGTFLYLILCPVLLFLLLRYLDMKLGYWK